MDFQAGMEAPPSSGETCLRGPPPRVERGLFERGVAMALIVKFRLESSCFLEKAEMRGLMNHVVK